MDFWIYFWLGLAVLTAILELSTMALTCIWFMFGSLVAWIAAMFHAPLWLQFALFAAISVLMLLLTRPIFVKWLRVGDKKTNIEAIPGKVGKVILDIKPVEGQGQVKLEGQIWSAKPEDGVTVIPEGASVLIVAVEGVKLVVRPF